MFNKNLDWTDEGHGVNSNIALYFRISKKTADADQSGKPETHQKSGSSENKNTRVKERPTFVRPSYPSVKSEYTMCKARPPIGEACRLGPHFF